MKMFKKSVYILLLWISGVVCQEPARLFWDTADKVDATIINGILVLMNKCLEYKLENELFVKAIQDLNDQLSAISIKLESKQLLQSRIEVLIQALSQRSAQGIDMTALLQTIHPSDSCGA
jgi:hypothetical protein